MPSSFTNITGVPPEAPKPSKKRVYNVPDGYRDINPWDVVCLRVTGQKAVVMKVQPVRPGDTVPTSLASPVMGTYTFTAEERGLAIVTLRLVGVEGADHRIVTVTNKEVCHPNEFIRDQILWEKEVEALKFALLGDQEKPEEEKQWKM